MTAIFRAMATFAFLMPIRLASFTPQALREDHSDKGKFANDLSVAQNENMWEYTLNQNSLRRTLNHRVPGSSPGAPTTHPLQSARFRYDAK
jgi:hypothetical protein